MMTSGHVTGTNICFAMIETLLVYQELIVNIVQQGSIYVVSVLSRASLFMLYLFPWSLLKRLTPLPVSCGEYTCLSPVLISLEFTQKANTSSSFLW